MHTHMETETQILEINLISAQGLKTPSTSLRRMRTYAIAWVEPSSKLRTRIDSLGGDNPTWNDKFLFRVTPEFVSGETSGVTVEIYAVGYIKDFHVGTVRFLLSSCLSKDSALGVGNLAFSAVQIRRPSGRFHGILNIALTLYKSSEFAMLDGLPAISFRDLVGKGNRRQRLRRIESRLSEQSSGGESCDRSCGSVDPSDSTESSSTTSSSSTTPKVLKDWNGGLRMGMAKIRDFKSDDLGSLCGLMLNKKICHCSLDQSFEFWDETQD